LRVSLTILGVDPGIASTGFGVIRAVGGEVLELLEEGVIRTEADTPHDRRLKAIYEGVTDLIVRHRPDAVAVEGIYFSRNLKSLVEVSEAIGVITLAAGNRDIGVRKFTPLEVKSAITGFGKADKLQVRHMVMALLGIDGSRSSHHASDALAVAICYKHVVCERSV
jgi:crossover junction endodeoxyribonuclease RuvC